jgi:predicted DNA-binding transcriptional regulator YafY
MPPSLPVGPDVEIDYTNHAGERRVRRIRPLALRFGTTPKQAEPRYTIDAIDLERNVERSFSVRDIHSWRELS